MSADRDDLSAVELAALEERITHLLLEEIAGLEHISDDGETALCGDSLVVDQPSGLPCPGCQEQAGRARYVWPRIGPAALAGLWVIAMTLGRYGDDLSGPVRAAYSTVALFAALGVVALVGRVRPTEQGGDRR
jgi:hypothetical protein